MAPLPGGLSSHGRRRWSARAVAAAAILLGASLLPAASGRAATGADGSAPAAGGDQGRGDPGPDGGAEDTAASGGDSGPGAGPDAVTREVAPPPVPPPAPPVTVPLRGRVLEKGTRRPVAGASVTVDAVPAAETDDGGRFELHVTPGVHHVQVQFPGHEVEDRRVDTASSAAELLFRLPPRQSGERYETSIVGGRQEVPHVDIDGGEARRTPGASGDPLRVIGSLPGVSQVVWPAAIYVIRGANPGNTGFYLDGIRVPALFHLALGPSIIHPYLIEGLDFYPGGYPASYGRYVSGIVSARTSAPPGDRVHASADVTLYDAGGIATAPFDDHRGRVAVAARYSYTGALFSLLASDTVLRYGDYQLRADHSLAGGQATLFAFGSLDNLGWRNPGETAGYASLQFHRLDARWLGGVGRGRLTAGVTGGVDWSSSTLFQKPIKVRALSAAPRLGYALGLGRGADLELGADLQAQSFVTEVPPFQGRQSDLGRSRSALSQGTFATLVMRAGRRLVVSPGARADLFAEEGISTLALQPRLDLLLRLTEALDLKLNGGRFVQMASLPVSVPGFEAFGLQSLGLQTSLGAGLGVEARLASSLTLGVTGYAQRLRLTDVRNIEIATMDPASPSYLVARNGASYGVELLLRRAERERLYGWLAYTLSWSLREDDNGVLGKSDWDQRHILNLVLGYRLRGGYSVGARAHYHTGRVAPIFNSGGRYQQLPAFYQLDLRADRRIIFDRFIMDVYADFANATLTREVVQVTQYQNGPSGMTTNLQQGFRIILPTIGVHAEF